MKLGTRSRIVLVVAVLGLLSIGATVTTETRQFEIISVDGNVLVVREASGTREVTVPPDFKFVVNGREMKVGELMPGMKGTATITTTTAIVPVYVTEVKNGEVLKVVGTSVIVRTAEGNKMFSQGEINKRGIRIYKDGKPVELSQLRERDRLTAMIVTEGPPEVLTAKQVEATLARAAAEPVAPAAVPPAAEPMATPAPMAGTGTEPVATPAAEPMAGTAEETVATPVTETVVEATPTEPAKAKSSWLLWGVLIVVAIFLLLFLLRRRRA